LPEEWFMLLWMTILSAITVSGKLQTVVADKIAIRNNINHSSGKL
jgi:hypothetical protein